VLAVAIHNHYKRIEHEMEAAQAKQQAEAQVRMHSMHVFSRGPTLWQSGGEQSGGGGYPTVGGKAAAA
jgi:ATP-dependent protease Clp ATPase subunit